MSVPIRQDGIWAWLICFGVFIAMFLETGLVKSLGVLLPDIREEFSTKVWVIGFAISSVPGFGAVSCEYAVFSTNRDNCLAFL